VLTLAAGISDAPDNFKVPVAIADAVLISVMARQRACGGHGRTRGA
jgi:Na+/serine symporter